MRAAPTLAQQSSRKLESAAPATHFTAQEAPSARKSRAESDYSADQGSYEDSSGSESQRPQTVAAPPSTPGANVILQERQMGDGKVERRYADGRRVVTFRNGTEKELAPDGRTVVRFVNGDIKTVSQMISLGPCL